MNTNPRWPLISRALYLGLWSYAIDKSIIEHSSHRKQTDIKIDTIIWLLIWPKAKSQIWINVAAGSHFGGHVIFVFVFGGFKVFNNNLFQFPDPENLGTDSK